MLIQNNPIQPNVAIFLDIDGVLGSNSFTIMQARDHNEIVRNLTGDRFHTYYCKNPCITCKTVCYKAKTQANFQLKKN